MKLNYRYTLAYAIITLIVLSIGFTIVYSSIRHSTIQSLSGKLEHLNDFISSQLMKGRALSAFQSTGKVTIKAVTLSDTSSLKNNLSINKEWNSELQSEVTVLRLSSMKIVNKQAYRITSNAILVELDDIYLNGIILVFAWTYVFLLALVIVLSEVLSWFILKPFNATLEAIQIFDINQNNPIDLYKTNTYEFRELNAFLVKMTNRAKSDYLALKEFSENASHELQTPIAIMKAKIELLMETSLQEVQVDALHEIHNELERLARINSSLTLLAKLEHYEMNIENPLDLSQLLRDTLIRFSDWIEMKNIDLQHHIHEQVIVMLDDALGQILLSNLVSNAIRHNILNGSIIIFLADKELIINNTGLAPSMPVNELFGRFKRGNDMLDSIGVGLAIVKKICELFHYGISYEYTDGLHSIRISFHK